MSSRDNLLYIWKERRRTFIDQLEYDDKPESAARVALAQSVIAAIEAEKAEPEPKKTGPKVEFGSDGWPLDPK